uniref:Ubiquitin-like protein ATG12 n=1 Tax=Aceria tosichella TaxID=561515 RepID=A0A6G1SHL6_9ACAR
MGDSNQEGQETPPEQQPQQQQQNQSQHQPTQQGKAPSPDETKIEIFLKNTGNAPVIKNNKTKWLVKASTKVSEVAKLLIKLLNLDSNQSIFIYVNQSFAPALDQTVQNLFDCYECDKKLVLYYATTQAWG